MQVTLKALRRLFAHKKSVVLPVYSCLSLWPTTPQNARPVVTPIDSFLKKKIINNEIIMMMTLMMMRMTMMIIFYDTNNVNKNVGLGVAIYT